MSELSSKLVKDKGLIGRNELNNNNSDLTILNQRTIECVSSGSSTNSDMSDVDTAFLDDAKSNEEELPKTHISRKLRSMSDGQAASLDKPEQVDAFPSLPDSVLEKLGLYGDREKERMNEEELEQKFIALSLAFSIDSATIKDRSERQRRYRDQTKVNLNTEIDKLTDQITDIRHLCMDAERAEHLTSLLTQVDVIMRASSHASISAERFGAVQHEARLAEAVNIMINHVTLLKQQRDSTRKQLQYTKKVFQDTNTNDLANVKRNTSISDRFLNQRRASIATIAQPQESIKTSSNLIDTKKLTRRTSDISSRVSAFARSSRPSRLELGVDLDKIREGIVDDYSASEPSECPEDCIHEDTVYAAGKEQLVDVSKSSFKDCAINRLKQLKIQFQVRYRRYSADGTLHDFLYVASLLCFVLGVVLLGNFLIEIQYSVVKFSTKNIQDFCKNVFEKRTIKN